MPTTIDTVEVKITVDKRLRDLMKELSRRRHMYPSSLYEEAIELYLNRDENYMGENNPVPTIIKDRMHERCKVIINAGQRCIHEHGHTGTHETIVFTPKGDWR